MWEWGTMADVEEEDVWNAVNVQIHGVSGEEVNCKEATAEGFAVSFLELMQELKAGS